MLLFFASISSTILLNSSIIYSSSIDGTCPIAQWAGTTILSGISAAVDPSTEIVYSKNPNADFFKSNNFSYAIVVVGETPYAETAGDSLNLTIAEPGPSTILNVCGNVKCVVVTVSGRPVVIEPYESQIDALVAAWLPGAEG